MEWLKVHKKGFLLLLGVLFLLFAILLYAWNFSEASESSKQSSSVTVVNNMIVHSSASSVAKSADISLLSKKLQNSNQSQILLLILIVLGLVSIIYALVSKPGNSDVHNT